MKKTFEQIKDDFVKAIRYEMGCQNSSFMMLSLHNLKIDHDLNPMLIGKLLRRFSKSVTNAMPEFSIKYKPSWEFEIEVKRIK